MSRRDEHGDDEGIDGAHRRRLGRREHAGIDAAHHDDDQEQAPDRLAEGIEALSPGRLRLARIVELLGAVPGHAAERCRQQQTGMTPAMNRAPTEVLVATEYITMTIGRRDQDAERPEVEMTPARTCSGSRP